tara:strand:- start:5783 stop:6691 length:909 start_codon:yes stop_codon:yes gene_type:complete
MKNFLLSITIIISASLNAQTCSDLFISEYVEGPAQNNGIEVYNPTNSAIDLAGYTINRYSNGATSGPQVWPLSGSIAAGDVIVVGNGQLDSIDLGTYWSVPVDPNFYAVLDDHCSGNYDDNNTFYFNGDDAITLEFQGTSVDIFGKVGEDPGMAWTDDVSAGYTDANGGTWWSKRQTLIRKSTVMQGVTQNPILFNPTLEYDSLPDATYSNLGSHVCDCGVASSVNDKKDVSYVMYPNPSKKGTSVSINSNNNIDFIKVTNILGETIIFDHSINTANLPIGSYIVNIRFTNGILKETKLIIN